MGSEHNFYYSAPKLKRSLREYSAEHRAVSSRSCAPTPIYYLAPELGRSLRDVDLKNRQFRYPLSYLVYSKTFDGMPDVLKERVHGRLWEVLSGQDTSKPFAHLSADDRTAITEILRDTKPNLPDYWRSSSSE